MGIGPLCRLFGKSRHAYYDRKYHFKAVRQDEIVVLELVAQVRRELPGLGLHKLYRCLYNPMQDHGIKMGRDKLNTVLRNHGLLIPRGSRKPRTTQSNHLLRRYPDLARHVLTNRPEQLWVSDITFICIGYGFNYLSLVTDAYSRKIMGYCLHPYLTNDGSINALKMALQNRSGDLPLIHHSDRGVQYCSYDYIVLLNENGIGISMTQHGEAYENPVAERVNGILKTEFKLGDVFKSRTEALLAVRRSVESYNTIRPHMSCSFLTPNAAHQTTKPLIKHWKNNRRKKKPTPELESIK